MTTVSKFPSKKFIGKEFLTDKGYVRRNSFTAPVAISATYIKGLTATSASLVTTFSTFTHQPDCVRGISITPGGTTADVATCDIVVNGTDVRGATISDTLHFTANDTLKQVSLKAFKTITSVVIPAQDGGGATFSVGVEDLLGLDRKMVEGSVLGEYCDGVLGAAATVTYSSTVLSLNTFIPATATNATHNYSVIFVSTEII